MDEQPGEPGDRARQAQPAEIGDRGGPSDRGQRSLVVVPEWQGRLPPEDPGDVAGGVRSFLDRGRCDARDRTAVLLERVQGADDEDVRSAGKRQYGCEL